MRDAQRSAFGVRERVSGNVGGETATVAGRAA